ncbi:MAG: hypothetical protein J2P41_11205 [Blastocatellia bacterium]|nr:hypothetical protein [Blastocatellia bacterium]
MSEVTVETIYEYIGKLTASDRARLYRMLVTGSLRNGGATGLENAKPGPIPEPDPAPNVAWIKEHGSEYAGLWVALDGDRLIASGNTEGEVATAARADGAYLPLVIYLPHQDEPDEIGF